MNEIKKRKRGFLGLLLAAVMILGMPGANVLAASYYSFSGLSNGMVLSNGDIINLSGAEIYLDNTPYGDAFTVNGTGITIVKVDTLANELYLASPVVNTPTTPATPVVVVTTQPQSTDFYGDYLEELAKLIKRIRRPGGEVHTFGSGDSLTYGVLKALADNPEDVLVFTTTYKNVKYTFTIQGGDYINNLITPEIPWYGPLWLAQNFYQTTVFEPAV